MSSEVVRRIKIKKGLDIPIAGRPTQTIDPGRAIRQVALLGADYPGLKARLLVKVGQKVGLGEPLLLDKRDPQVVFASPGTGRVAAIHRGRRHRFQSVVVELDETAATETTFGPLRKPIPTAVRELLLCSGAWVGFRTRPYNRIPDSSSTPRAIFVTAIDTRPLAADPSGVIAEREKEFKTGMEIISMIGDWPIYLCTGPTWLAPEFGDSIQRVVFDGPHPSGLAGTHIHHLCPVTANRTVWHIGYQDVIAIGHLFETGRLSTERVVSVAGPGALKPRLIRTRLGVNITQLMLGEVVGDRPCRQISGSILDGRAATEPTQFLGRYHDQISILPEKAERRLLGWLTWRPGDLLDAEHKLARLRELTTAQHGRQAAMLPVPAFERIMPLDILPVPLLRALLVEDTDAAEALGCLELAEEDLALSSFVCPAKLDYGAVLRINLDLIQRDN